MVHIVTLTDTAVHAEFNKVKADNNFKGATETLKFLITEYRKAEFNRQHKEYHVGFECILKTELDFFKISDECKKDLSAAIEEIFNMSEIYGTPFKFSKIEADTKILEAKNKIQTILIMHKAKTPTTTKFIDTVAIALNNLLIRNMQF